MEPGSREQTSPDIVAEGERLVRIASGSGLTLRLLGGIAIRLRCPSSTQPPFSRNYGDLDFAAPARTGRAVATLLESAGYRGDRRFNALHGHKRLRFLAAERDWHVDIFLGTFDMCHSLDLESRLQLDCPTLPLADLLLTKLQVVKLNRKDALDILALLSDHEVAEPAPGRRGIDGARVAAICAEDWGWHTTVSENLQKVEAVGLGLGGEARERATRAIHRLRSAITEAPKSLRWRLRSVIGRRMAWYEEPEEVATEAGI
jgi:hypothetical protein